MNKKMLSYVALPLMLMSITLSYAHAGNTPTVVVQAQRVTTKGTVVDASGEPLSGVTVREVGTSNGAITDFNGAFTITTAKGAVLEFTYIGFKSHKQAIAAGMKVVLSEDAKALDEVVVTALGIKRQEKALSYNVQQIKGDELTAVKDANFVNSLNGKVAGVNMQRSASGVGGGVRVVMRGNKSIEGDNNVLYVIDGIPVGNNADRGGDGSGFGGAASGEGISAINPDDIESISVLTGPSAAALYGAAAANGVILITTKKGAEGKLRLNVSSAYEASKPLILPRFQNRYGNNPNDYFSWGDKLEQPSSYNPASFFQTGQNFNNSFNLSVGSEKNQTYLSASAINSKGIVPNNKYHRYNATVRNTAKFLDDKFTVDASASYIREYYNNMVSYGTYFNPIVATYLYPRGENFEQEKVFERYDDDLGAYRQAWSVGDLGKDIQNPYWTVYRNLRPEVKDRYMFYLQAKYDINKELNVAARARLDNTYAEKEDKRFASTIKTFAAPKGRYNYRQYVYRQKYADVMLNYAAPVAEKWHVTANVGSSVEEYDMKGRGYGGELLRVPNKFSYNNIDPTKAVPSEDGGNSRDRNVAIFGSAEVAWNSALYLTLTGRTDHSSKLVNSADEWIFYPSVGLSALVTELLPDQTKTAIRPYLSYFKVRGSFTEVGSPIPYAGLTPGTETRKLVAGTIQPYEYYPVENLKAERTRSYELGFDTKWFDNLLSVSLSLYHSNTFNQLLKKDLPKSAGYKYMFAQAGNVQNRGLELTVGIDKSIGDFSTATTFTATANRNRIINLAGQVKNPVTGEMIDLSEISVGRFRLVKDGEIGMMYSNKRIQRDQDGYVTYTPGGVLLTETTEPFKIGSVNPKWMLGLSQRLAYKGLSLNLHFTGRVGGVVISKTQAALDYYGVSEESAKARDRGVVSIGKGLEIDPRNYYNAISELDSYYTYSATNFRLQEARLTYSLPQAWLKGLCRNAALSLYSTNVWMIYNKAPYDPELTAGTGTFGQGYDYFMQPSLRTVGMSLNLGF